MHGFLQFYDELHVYHLTPGRPSVRLQKTHQGVIELEYASLNQSDPRIIVGLRKFTEPIKHVMYDASEGLTDEKAVVITKAKLEGYNPSDLVIEDVS